LLGRNTKLNLIVVYQSLSFTAWKHVWSAMHRNECTKPSQVQM